MSAQGDLSSQKFPKWLTELGKGLLNDDHDNVILPQSLRCSTNDIGALIDHAYPSIHIAHTDDYFKQRCILAPRDREVHEINKIVMERFPGSLRDAWSANEAIDPDPQTQTPEAALAYDCPIEFLHGINPPGLPHAHIPLKEGCPIMFLRDVSGFCDGSRGIVTKIGIRVLEVRMLSGDIVLVPRIPHILTDTGLPFQIRRLQFPVALAFAMTIEKAQGQTFSAVGIDLRYPCFRHGQLYLALSRANSLAGTKCIVGTNTGKSNGKTKNIVYPEVVSAMSHT